MSKPTLSTGSPFIDKSEVLEKYLTIAQLQHRRLSLSIKVSSNVATALLTTDFIYGCIPDVISFLTPVLSAEVVTRTLITSGASRANSRLAIFRISPNMTVRQI